MASKITIAIPNRNNEKHLSQCLSSVQLQRERPFRVIISDNYSNDGSLGIIDKFCDIFDERLRTPEPLSYMDHLYWILERVDTEFVIFAAGDDILHPDLVSRYNEILSGPSDYAFVCSPFYSIDKHSRLMSKVDWPHAFHAPGVAMKDVFLRGPICNISSVAWNVSKLKRTPRLPSEMGNCIDWYLYVYLSATGCVGLVFQKLLFYRVYSGSTGNSNVREHTKKCKEMFTWLKTKNLVEGFDRDAYDFLISGFNEVLEKESPQPKLEYGHFRVDERFQYSIFTGKIRRTIAGRIH